MAVRSGATRRRCQGRPRSSGAVCPCARSSRRRVVTIPSMAELAWASIRAAVWNDAYGAASLRVASRSASSAAVTSWQRLSTALVVSCSPGTGGRLLWGNSGSHDGYGSVRVLADVVSGADGGRGMWWSALGRLRNWRWNPAVRVDLEGGVPAVDGGRALAWRAERIIADRSPLLTHRSRSERTVHPLFTTGEPLCRLCRIQPSRREKSWVSDAGTGVAHPSGSLISVRLHDSAIRA